MKVDSNIEQNGASVVLQFMDRKVFVNCVYEVNAAHIASFVKHVIDSTEVVGPGEQLIDAAQIARAKTSFAARTDAEGVITARGNCYDVLEKLLAGEFKAPPLPEIKQPKWAAAVELSHTTAGTCFVYAVGPGGWPSVTGPHRDNKRDAILTFNELFGDR
jgi:hypothetical protein